jgi:16S rRNA G966 N2-methylase RsmD
MANYKGDDRLEKHYTPIELLDEMWDIVERFHPNPTEILENSAGGGAMIDYIKDKSNVNIIAYDIHNETLREDIKECNYLKEKIEYKEGRLAFINPPFQKGLKFCYKALEECDRVIAILSQNSLINIDYDKYYLEEGQLWRNVDFGSCKVGICIISLRKKRGGDSYE